MNNPYASKRLPPITAIVLAAAGVSLCAWNLPYDQLPKYNFSHYYHESMRKALVSAPEYLKSEMTLGWSYYKENYIMSNGLVNHKRKDGSGNVIGMNEAVSEGQGYGMLLAVLNNDQATFNRIFEAANQHIWDGSHKSYFKWQWPDNSNPGAATDAEIDICTALIFADMLQKRSLWAKYDKGGVTYNSRAMDVMRSIRNNMTSNGYLLPGDNWQGSGLNNLNPSYFATGFMKMFNAYQKELDFTPVIDKCYQVLKMRDAQYKKGQAPDWITSGGGKASKGGLGMTVESIRAPWRIATDAIWYDDSRAIAFCKNAKNTLTRYSDPNKAMVLGQMAQYDENTTIIVQTAGLMKEIAMWECSALGSKDTAFAGGCLSSIGFGEIAGAGKCFGDAQVGDHLYYYNQSLGLLGFALISGMFPNVYDDLKDSVPHVAVVSLSSLSRRVTTGIRIGPEGISLTLPEFAVGGGSVAVGIFDLQGKKVFSRTVGPEHGRYVLLGKGTPGPGMYVLRLRAGRGTGGSIEYTHTVYWN